jgi:hypothetical protein
MHRVIDQRDAEGDVEIGVERTGRRNVTTKATKGRTITPLELAADFFRQLSVILRETSRLRTISNERDRLFVIA